MAGKEKRDPERKNKIKVKFNIWFVIIIVKLRHSTLVGTKRDNLGITPPTWPSITQSRPFHTAIQVLK